MIKEIIFKSDWWIHILASLLLFVLVYLIEYKYLKRSIKLRNVFWQIMLANLIDLDHLFTRPIYESGRCSIGNHFLHSRYFIFVYILGLFTKFRYFFFSILIHLLIDSFCL